MLIGSGAALVAVIVVGWVIATRGTAPAPVVKQTTTQTHPLLAQVNPAPTPLDLVGRKSGPNVEFTWRNPAPLAGDQYQWRRTDQNAAGTVSWTNTSTATATVSAVARACIEVVIIRADSSMSSALQACGPGN